MRIAAVVLLALAAGAGAAAQVAIPGFPGFPAQGPARDATRNAVGTATVSGIVRTGDAPGRPLRRVRVTLQSADVRAPIAAITDDEGRFELTGVLAGHYTVMATRPGYVNTILGAESGSLFGAPIAVADGQHLTGLAIDMPRGGVITGTVRYPSGRPARGLQVQVSAVRTVDGKRRTRFDLNSLAMAGTDDRGVYRQFGLPPGDYVVQLITAPGPAAGAQAIRQSSADEIAWAERLVAARGLDTGAAAPSGPAPGALVLPAPIYYPGTPSIEAARIISIGRGEERAGVDLVVEYVPTTRVSGRVFDIDGRPRAGATVTLNGRGGSSSIAEMVGALMGRGVRSGEDGTFVIDAVPPGDYVLSSQAPRSGEAPAPGAEAQPNLMTMVSTMFGRGGGAGALHASTAVVVTGQEVSNVELRLGDGSTVSGTIVFEGAATRPAPASMQVMLMGVAQTGSPLELAMSMAQGASAPVNADLTFTLRGVVPNRYRATVNLPGAFFGTALPNATWTVKSVRGPGGVDLADVPFDVDPGRSVDGIVVTLTDTPTVVSGKVVDGEGRPSSAFPIVIFSTDPAHWLNGARRVQQVRPASDGTYRVSGLPAGEYYIGAVTAVALEDLYEPSFLQQIVPIAFRLTLADGEQRTQDLRIGR